MEIKELISVFEKLLPIYKEAYLERISKEEIWRRDLCNGICWLAHQKLNNLSLESVFNSYYKNLLSSIDKMFLFEKPEKWQHLKSRIDFMESEIKDLKHLLKKGYTHV